MCTVILGPLHINIHPQWFVGAVAHTQECVAHFQVHVSHAVHVGFRLATNTQHICKESVEWLHTESQWFVGHYTHSPSEPPKME